MDARLGRRPFFAAEGGTSVASSGVELASGVLTVALFSSTSGSASAKNEINVSNLAQPITLSLAVEPPPAPGPNASAPDYSEWRVRCSYWHERQRRWVIDGEGVLQGNASAGGAAVVCRTTHLTEFGAFWGPPPRFNRISFDKLWRLHELNPTGFWASLGIFAATLLSCFFSLRTMRRLKAEANAREGWDQEHYEADAASFALQVLSPRTLSLLYIEDTNVHRKGV